MQETCIYSSSSLQQVCNLDKKTYVYEIAENTPQYHCEGSLCPFRQNWNKYNHNNSGYNLVTVSHQVSDHCLQYEHHWLAVISTFISSQQWV
jgi:hypothetical protein